MKPTQIDDFLQELKELLDYAVDSRSWATVEEVREMVYEELGEEMFDSDDEEDDV